jgi:hypothetical protein
MFQKAGNFIGIAKKTSDFTQEGAACQKYAGV